MYTLSLLLSIAVMIVKMNIWLSNIYYSSDTGWAKNFVREDLHRISSSNLSCKTLRWGGGNFQKFCHNTLVLQTTDRQHILILDERLKYKLVLVHDTWQLLYNWHDIGLLLNTVSQLCKTNNYLNVALLGNCIRYCCMTVCIFIASRYCRRYSYSLVARKQHAYEAT